jgi:hypothetical protein
LCRGKEQGERELFRGKEQGERELFRGKEQGARGKKVKDKNEK